MRHFFKYICVGAMAAVALTACQDDVDAPAINTPVATLKPNTTIIELKTSYWSDDANYIDTVGVADDGTHVVISGHVISDDYAGNIYKNLVIQDESGAITLSINKNNLYTDYRVGQRVMLDVTGMYIGKYSSLQQLGFPDYSGSYGWQATFMPYEFFAQHVQLDGLPDIASVDTITTTIASLSTSPEGLRSMQSQLVRLNNVHFEEGGQPFCTAHKVNTNRTLVDADGNTIIVRTSGYANFWSTAMPKEAGDVVGILSYNGSGSSAKWQLLLRSTADLLNFGNPTLPKGLESNPYSVDEAVAIENTGASTSGWVAGYIVGAVKSEVTAISSSDDIEWGAPTTMNNTLVIGQSADTRSLDNALVISLPQGSALRRYGNLRDNPEVYKRQISVYGTLAKYMDTYGITGNKGTTAEFHIENVTPEEHPDIPANALTELDVTFDGVTSISQLKDWSLKMVSGNKDWFFRSYNDNSFAEVTAYKGTPGASGFDSWLITPPLNIDGMTEKVLSFKSCVGYTGEGRLEVYALSGDDPATAERTKLNATIAQPTGSWSDFVGSGTISLDHLSGVVYIGFRYLASEGSSYTTYRVDDVLAGKTTSSGGGETPGPGGDDPQPGNGDGTQAKPYSVAQVIAMGKDATKSDAWVSGYIVGWIDNSSQTFADEKNCVFTTPATSPTNMLIADNANETNYTKCVAVNLPNNNDIRKGLNLVDNPSNLHKRVLLNGNIRKYFNICGLRDTKSYTLY